MFADLLQDLRAISPKNLSNSDFRYLRVKLCFWFRTALAGKATLLSLLPPPSPGRFAWGSYSTVGRLPNKFSLIPRHRALIQRWCLLLYLSFVFALFNLFKSVASTRRFTLSKSIETRRRYGRDPLPFRSPPQKYTHSPREMGSSMSRWPGVYLGRSAHLHVVGGVFGRGCSSCMATPSGRTWVWYSHCGNAWERTRAATRALDSSHRWGEAFIGRP